MWHRKTARSSLLTFMLCCSWISYAASQGRPPVIIKEPSDVVAAKNAPADLECGVLNPSKAAIHWLHNGVKVEDDAKRVTMDDGSLHFVRVTRNRKRTHAGIYQCVASNSYGTTRSRNASLIVGTFKSTFRSEPKNQSVFTGATVVLSCSPPKGRPPPTVSWLHDWQVISNSSRTVISPKGNLTISSVTKADQGSYVCRAVHQLGTRNSQQAILTVKEFVNPLTVIPSQQVAYKGSTTTFQCNYEGGSQEEVTWEKKDGLLPSGRHVIDKGQLNITDVGFKDEGTYVCKATIGPRVLTAEATLDVQCTREKVSSK